MLIYVVCRDFGYDGFGTPEIAFETNELADEYVKRHTSIHHKWVITELFVRDETSSKE
jgi:hypothetical protein